MCCLRLFLYWVLCFLHRMRHTYSLQLAHTWLCSEYVSDNLTSSAYSCCVSCCCCACVWTVTTPHTTDIGAHAQSRFSVTAAKGSLSPILDRSAERNGNRSAGDHGDTAGQHSSSGNRDRSDAPLTMQEAQALLKTRDVSTCVLQTRK